MTIADDPSEAARDRKQLAPLLRDPSQSVQIGYGTIDEEAFPANLIVVRFPSGILTEPGVVERALKQLTFDGLLGKLGTFTVRGVAVLVDRLPCVGEMDPGSVCYVAAYVRGDDLVWINSDSTKPLAAARTFVTAIITATP